MSASAAAAAAAASGTSLRKGFAGAVENEDREDPPSDVDEDDEEESEDDASEEDVIDTGLTENQGRLLYMIGLYTRPARSGAEKEEWIRRQALLVLVYEAIVAQVLDYDYAPSSTIVEGHRRYFNKSQEGASDIDFLREEDLLNGLKLGSKTYHPVTCYQISKKGQELIKRMPKADKDAVHELVYAPGTRELLRVVWRGEEYALVGPDNFERISAVTDCEDVSYVSSAYIPQCLRFGGRPTLSNAHRAGECAVGSSNIRDELEEIITLNSVSIMLAEYVPFGANQVVMMNQNLGTTERVQGGFFTALVDEDTEGTKFEVEPGLTAINVLDYTQTRHVNFEADIRLPEEPGIVQVESFGVSMNADGTAFYGMQIEAIMDRIKDNISLDHLSRLLVDVSCDSSTIVDSVLSAYQRRLLQLIFDGDASQRDKFTLVIANEITPHLTAEEYMDRGEYENELRQIIGDTRAAFDISEHDTLVFGESGLLIAGPNSRHHEPLLCSYLQFTAMDLFVRNFWNRIFVLADLTKEVRDLINRSHEDPTTLVRVQPQLQRLTDDVQMMGEILGYLTESLEMVEVPPEPTEAAGRALYERLQIADLAGQLSLRVIDLKKTLRGEEHQLAYVRQLHQLAQEEKHMRTQQILEYNTRQLVLLNETHEKTASALEIIELMIAGVLAFAVMDRLTGDWSVMDSEWMISFADPMIKNSPLVWFLFNMLFWAALAFGLNRLLNYFVFRSLGRITLRIAVNQRVRPDRFNTLLQAKATSLEERAVESLNTLVRISWDETDMKVFGGTLPRVTVEYDTATAFLHYVYITYNRRAAKKELALDAVQVRNRIAEDFKEAGVFDDPEYSFEEELAEEDESIGLAPLPKSSGGSTVRGGSVGGSTKEDVTRGSASVA